MTTAAQALNGERNIISITPLLKRLWPSPEQQDVTADEVATAVSHTFTHSLSDVQAGALLTCLHFTGWDRRADVIRKCAEVMRDAGAPIDMKTLRPILRERSRKEGIYRGGLCDIVGTGGDSHNTFNISTTASIIASSYLLMAKHGNRSSTSMSGSADLLENVFPTPPKITAISPNTIAQLYSETNYAFLYAPTFHPGAKHIAPIRKELGWRTIFNLLGPLANPLDAVIEARVIGVARRDLGPVFAQALLESGAKKAMVICGAEDLDELSCAGPTYCWQLVEKPNPDFKGSKNVEDDEYTTSDAEAPPRTIVEIRDYILEPADFGVPRHPLSEVSPGKEPKENAKILLSILKGERAVDDPIMDFVLMNAAALFVTAGICEADTSSLGEGDDGNVISERGPGDGRWKEGLRRARLAVQSGAAYEQWEKFVSVTHVLGSA